jgi:hypothetical protein
MGGGSQTVTTGYRYALDILFGLCHGAVNRISKIRVDEKTAFVGSIDDSNPSQFINEPQLFGGDGDQGEGGWTGTVYLGNDGMTNAMRNRVEAGLGQDSPKYTGLATALFSGPGFGVRFTGLFGETFSLGSSGRFYFGNTPYLKAPQIQVMRTTAGWNTDVWYAEKASIPRQFDNGVWEYQIIGGPGDPRVTPPNLSNPSIPSGGWTNEARQPFGYCGDDASWPEGQAIPESESLWPGRSEMWLRKTFRVSDDTVMRVAGRIENSVYVFVDGEYVGGYNTTNTQIAGTPEFSVKFSVGPGEHTVVVLGLDENATGEDTNVTYLAVELAATEGADMNPAHIVYQCLTDPEWGMGYPTADIGEVSFTAAADKLFDERFGLSLGWFGQEPVEDFVQLVMSHVNGVVRLDKATGKFTIKLLRDDYDAETLPVLNESNSVLEGFSRASWGDLANEVTITYEDDDGNEQIAREQNLAAIAAQGAVISKNLQYPGLRSARLAGRVARRELRQASSLLAQATLTCDRTVDLEPGDVFTFEWPTLGITSVVMRVASVDRGTLANGTVRIQAVEDIFSTPESSYTEVQDNLAPRFDSAPQDITEYRLIEVPYYTALSETPTADFEARTADSCYARFLAVPPNGVTVNFALGYSADDTTYEQISEGLFSPYVRSSGAYGHMDTVIDVTTPGPEPLAPGDYCDWNGEIVRVDAVDYESDPMTVTLGRGCLDTLPIEHADGEAILLVAGRGVSDPVERVEGQTAYYKALPRTVRGVLAEADATAHAITFENRLERPYLPGKIQINGEYFPETITGELEVTWAHRDRTQQTASVVDFTEDSIGPEASVTYTLRLYGEDGALVRTASGLTGTSYTWATEADDSGLAGSTPTLVTLLGFDGANASTEFVDDTGREWTVNGNAQISTAQSKWGGASGYFDGTGDYLSGTYTADFDAADGFTVEAWVRSADVSSDRVIMQAHVGSSYVAWELSQSSTGYVQFLGYDGTNASVVSVVASSSLTLNTWHHVTASIDGSTVRLFLDGALVGSGTLSGTVRTDATALRIGAHGYTAGRDWNGYIDDLRVISDVARYTTAFSLPIGPFTVSGPVSILTFDGANGSTTFEDAYGYTWTASGNAQISDANSKFGGTSLRLDGAGDYISTANAAFALMGLSSWTIEFWVKIESLATGARFFYNGDPTSNDHRIQFYSTAAGEVSLYIQAGTGTGVTVITSAAGAVGTYSWHHIALTRNGNNYAAWVDGIQVGSGSYSTAVTADEDFYLGAYRAGGSFVTDTNAYFDAFVLRHGAYREGPNFYNPKVETLLRFNGSNASTTFTDAVGRSWTRSGNAQISTAQSKFGGSSGYFDGTGDYLTTPDTPDLEVTTQDWTIECWVRFSAIAANGAVIATKRAPAGNDGGWQFGVHSSKVPQIAAWDTGGTVINVLGATVLTTGTWYHLAATKSGTTWRVFVDGVLDGSGTQSATPTANSRQVIVGRHAQVTTYDLNGYIDDLRITNGEARYTAAFTPPASEMSLVENVPAPSRASTTSLLHFNGSNGSTVITDSAYPTAWTVYGNAQISTAQAQFGSSSLLLDGSGDYLEAADSGVWFVGGSDFTIEAWIRLDALPGAGAYAPICSHGASTSAGIFFAVNEDGALFFSGGAGSLTAGSVSAATWTHVAVSRQDGTVRLFVGGVLVGTGVLSDWAASVSGFRIGRGRTSSTNYLYGHIDEFRFTHGAARYTSTFTPAAQPFEVVSSANLNSSVRVRLKAVRDGVESWQEFDWTVIR